jgi:hypothetical protein
LFEVASWVLQIYQKEYNQKSPFIPQEKNQAFSIISGGIHGED